MTQVVDPSAIRSRPASVALGEPANAAGPVGHSVTIACDFPADVLCPIWRHHARSLGAVIHARIKKDMKPDFIISKRHSDPGGRGPRIRLNVSGRCTRLTI